MRRNRYCPEHVLFLVKPYQTTVTDTGVLVTPQAFDNTPRRKVEKQAAIIQVLKSVNLTVLAPLKENLVALETLYGHFSVRTLCGALEVSRGTFYNHIPRNMRDNTWCAKRRAEIGEKVREIYEETHQIFGADKICAILIQRGERASNIFVISIYKLKVLHRRHSGSVLSESHRPRNIHSRQYQADRGGVSASSG